MSVITLLRPSMYYISAPNSAIRTAHRWIFVLASSIWNSDMRGSWSVNMVNLAPMGIGIVSVSSK